MWLCWQFEGMQVWGFTFQNQRKHPSFTVCSDWYGVYTQYVYCYFLPYRVGRLISLVISDWCQLCSHLVASSSRVYFLSLFPFVPRCVLPLLQFSFVGLFFENIPAVKPLVVRIVFSRVLYWSPNPAWHTAVLWQTRVQSIWNLMPSDNIPINLYWFPRYSLMSIFRKNPLGHKWPMKLNHYMKALKEKETEEIDLLLSVLNGF